MQLLVTITVERKIKVSSMHIPGSAHGIDV